MTKRILRCALLLLAAALLAPAVPALAQDDSKILPPDSAVAGWRNVDSPKRFTQADLYGYIDGGAELFLEYGFEQLTVQKYRNGADEYTLEVYRMADPAAAIGVYLMKAGKETPAAGFKERNTSNKYQLMFVRNRYFTIVNNVSGKEPLRPLQVQFGSQLATKMPPAVPIAELKSLPSAGLVPGSARLVRGAYGLQAVYTLGEGDILQLGQKLTAVSGEYKTSQGAYTLIVADYTDAAQATRAFDHLRTNLDSYLKIVEQRPDRFVFQDYAKRFGVASIRGRRLEAHVKLAKRPR